MVQKVNNLMKDQNSLHLSTWIFSLHNKREKGGREEERKYFPEAPSPLIQWPDVGPLTTS